MHVPLFAARASLKSIVLLSAARSAKCSSLPASRGWDEASQPRNDDAASHAEPHCRSVANAYTW